LQSLVWRTRWEQTADDGLRQKLLAYNLEDCAALQRVTEFLFAVAANERGTDTPARNQTGSTQLPDVQDVAKLAFPPPWGPNRFFHPDFAYITKCSYFNCQRQRVYIRTLPRLKQARRRQTRRVNRKLRASIRLVVEARNCPHCKSKDIVQIARN